MATSVQNSPAPSRDLSFNNLALSQSNVRRVKAGSLIEVPAGDRTRAIVVVSFSGGKDSASTLALALDRYGPNSVRLVFVDTGNEHRLLLDYVHDYIPRRFNMAVETLKAEFSAQIARKRIYVEEVWPIKGVPDAIIARALSVLHPTGVPFLDLCLWKGRFPSRKAQFCTQELKRRPLDKYMLNLLTAGCDQLESWQGVRRDESEARKDVLDRELTPEGWWIVRPPAAWSAAEVFQFLADRNIEPNPLYRLGMKRVGCMPCINCGKDELLEISKRFPEHIDKVREWETLVSLASKRGWTTFFTDDADDDESDEEIFARLKIDERIKWSKTSRGGKQYDMLRLAPAAACSSSYGLCE